LNVTISTDKAVRSSPISCRTRWLPWGTFRIRRSFKGYAGLESKLYHDTIGM